MRALCLVLLYYIEVMRASKSIRCQVLQKSQCYQKQEAVLLSDRRYLTCQIKAVMKTPTSNEEDETAETPESLAVDWYIYHRKIALNISWIHKEQYLKNPKFKGFFLSVEAPEEETQIKYVTSINILEDRGNLTVINNATDKNPFVTFNFLCHGRTDQYIRSEDKRIVSLHSLPLPTHEYRLFTKVNRITIPDCWDKERGKELMKTRNNYIVKNQKGCKNYWEKQRRLTTTVLTTHKEIHSDDQKGQHLLPSKSEEVYHSGSEMQLKVIVLVAMGSLLVLTFGAVVAIIVRNRKAERKTSVRHAKVLLVADSTERSIITQCYNLAFFLKDNFYFTITMNWEHREKITASPQQWYNSIEADIIILIKLTTELENDGLQQDQDGDMMQKEVRDVEKYMLRSWTSSERDIICLLPPSMTSNRRKRRSDIKMYPFKERYSVTDDLYQHFKNFEKTRRNREEGIYETTVT